MSIPVLTAAERHIGVVTLVLLIVGILIAAGASPGPLDRQEVLADAEMPDYRIIDIEEQADGRMLTAHVVVDGTPDADGLIAVSAAVVDRLREEPGYNGLRVNLYDHESYRVIGPTLGQTFDAPNGDWTQTLRATRDYRLHQTVIEVRDKDWDQRPEEGQIETVVAWQQEQGAAIAGGPQTAEVLADHEPDGPTDTVADDQQVPEGLEHVYGWTVAGERVEVVLE